MEFTVKEEAFNEEYMLQITEKIRSMGEVCLFSIGFITQYSLLCSVMKIHYYCILPDDGRGEAYSYAVKDPGNRIFTADPLLFSYLKDCGCERICFLPLGYDIDTTQKPEKEQSKDVILWCEGGRDYLTVNNLINGLKDASKGYIDAMLQARRADLMLGSVTGDLQQYVLDDLKENVEFSQNSLLNFEGYCDHTLFFPVIDRAMSFIYYHMLLSNGLVKEVSFAMDGDLPYTNKELLKVRRNMILQNDYKPLEDYKVIVFFTPYSEDGIISKDLWNIMAKGFFVLVSANTDMSPLGDEAPDTFRNTWELEEKVRFYLKNPDARKQKAEIVRKHVLEMGSLESRFEIMLGGL